MTEEVTSCYIGILPKEENKLDKLIDITENLRCGMSKNADTTEEVAKSIKNFHMSIEEYKRDISNFNIRVIDVESNSRKIDTSLLEKIEKMEIKITELETKINNDATKRRLRLREEVHQEYGENNYYLRDPEIQSH